MSIELFIALMGLMIACVSLGYMIGKDLNQQK